MYGLHFLVPFFNQCLLKENEQQGLISLILLIIRLHHPRFSLHDPGITRSLNSSYDTSNECVLGIVSLKLFDTSEHLASTSRTPLN